jgi:MFS family permease
MKAPKGKSMSSTLFRLPAAGAILVAALGYFVDVYDLVLFLVVRVSSLQSLGLNPTVDGEYLLRIQMIGMLVGGVFWGILGDRKGRLSVLFGSILLYSVANILNAFVYDLSSYVVLRFMAGVGLAGELGAGITLVSELLPSEKRGLGTTLVATVGVAGAVVAASVGGAFDWRTAYLIGGGLGIVLLFLRVSVSESGMFQKTSQESELRKGDIRLILFNRGRLLRYLGCILAGTTTWFVVGVLVAFSPEIAAANGVLDPVKAGESVKYAYIGLVLGDLTCGLFSQYLKSRKFAIVAFHLCSIVTISCYLSVPVQSASAVYWLCLPMGFTVGYWAVFVTAATEQFGTNLRSLVTTTVPNFVRGLTPIFTMLFMSLRGSWGVVGALYLVGAICITLSLIGLCMMRETFTDSLDFSEVA